MLSDKIGDLIIRLKNGSMRGLRSVKVSNSRLNREILDCLVQLGFLSGYSLEKEFDHYLKVFLVYKYNEPVIANCWRISKPSKRVYWSYDQLALNRARNVGVVYTSSVGIMSNMSMDFDVKKVGGEPLFGIQ